jgi:serine phosphatase RsbU (regulator of sigma subunit)
LHAKQLGQQRVLGELETARALQRRLLPEFDPALESLDVSGETRTSSVVGGDFYCYIPFEDGRLGVAVGDVAGHGVTAALLMASLSATLRAEAERKVEPGLVLRALNERACETMEAGQFVSAFYAIWYPATRELEYANAGHPVPLLIQPNGSVSGLWTGNLLIGIDPDAPYRAHRVRCAPGSVILLYTDGLVDGTGPSVEAFGEDRLIDLVRGDGLLSAEGLRRHILDEFDRQSPQAAEDDVTLIVMRVR